MIVETWLPLDVGCGTLGTSSHLLPTKSEAVESNGQSSEMLCADLEAGFYIKERSFLCNSQTYSSLISLHRLDKKESLLIWK
jgi:hypothetical protein